MLNNIDKKNPFKVPENYFRDFNADMISKLPEKEPKAKVVPLWSRVSKWVAVAAAVVVISVVGINYADTNSTANMDNQTNTLDDKLALLQNDYYLFLEDEANQSIYNEVLYSE